MLLLEAVDPVAAPAAEPFDDPHARVERGRFGEVGFAGVAAVAAGLGVLERNTGVSLNLSNSQSYFFVQLAFWVSLSGEWPADQNEVARSRPPWQGVHPKELEGCIDSLPTMRWIRG